MSPSSMNAETTIAETAGLCFNAFQQCLEKSAFISPREMSRVEDQFARFSLWTANIGVFASGRASLDHRLREAQEVHEVITGLLEALDDKIIECTSYLKSFIEPEGDDAHELNQEKLDKHIQGLANQITLLHRLSNTIRKASSETQNAKAANTFKILDEEGNNVEPLLEIIFANYVRDKFRSIDEKILQRLVRAMITRWKRVLYKRSRFGNLALRVKETQPRPKVQAPQIQRQQTPVTQNSAEDKAVDELKEDDAKANHKSQAGVSATTLAADKFKKASAPSVISGTKTVAFDNHEDLPFPLPPLGRVRRRYKRMKRELEEQHKSNLASVTEGSKSADLNNKTDYQVKANVKLLKQLNECWDQCLRAVGEVTCPFCFYAVSAVDISDDARWRSHVRNDLDAYICLFEQCHDQEKLFGHSEEWLRHMREHALRWPCNSKSHGTIVFDSRDEYTTHLKEGHKNNFSDVQLRVLSDRNARTIGPLFESCPFCGFDDTSNGIKIEEHIVGHLRFLALKSLPPYEDERSESSDAETTSSKISKPRKRSTIENDPDKEILPIFIDNGAIEVNDPSEESLSENEHFIEVPETERRGLEWGFVTEIFDQNVNANDDFVLQHLATKQTHQFSAGWKVSPEEVKHFRKSFLKPDSYNIPHEHTELIIKKGKEWMRMSNVPESLSEIDDDEVRIAVMEAMSGRTNVSDRAVRVPHDQHSTESHRQIEIQMRGDQRIFTGADQDREASDKGKHKIIEVYSEFSPDIQVMGVGGMGSVTPQIRESSSEVRRKPSDDLLLLRDPYYSTDPQMDQKEYLIVDKETAYGVPIISRGRRPERITSEERRSTSTVGIHDLDVTAIEPERRRDAHSLGTRLTETPSSRNQRHDDKDNTPVVERREVDHISENPMTGEIPNAVPRQNIAGDSILVNIGASSEQPELPNLDDGVLDDMIQRLLASPRSSPKTLCISNEEIKTLCAVARELFLSQPVLLELKAPVKIVGDIHGQYTDLLRMFELSGYPPNENYLFLGDYVDRGKLGLETILLLLCFKLKYPENFFLLRGNHECANVTRVYGFYDECKRRCNVKMWKTFVDVFNCLPVAAVVSEKIFCVHGGLSPSLGHMNDVRAIVRPTDIPDYGLLNDLLWSDPALMDQDWEANERGVSYTFGKNVIREFLTKFDFDLICRAHMVVEDGYEFFEDRLLVTIFTAPNYCGEFDNWGAIMSVSDDLLCSFELLKPLWAEGKPPKAAKSLTANLIDRWKKWTAPSGK